MQLPSSMLFMDDIHKNDLHQNLIHPYVQTMNNLDPMSLFPPHDLPHMDPKTKSLPHSFISYAHLCPLKLHKVLNRDGKDAEMVPILILLSS